MQPTTDQHRADPPREEGEPMRGVEVASGRFLLAAIVISELACLALVAALVL